MTAVKKKIKWYETYNIHTKRRYWWTQRDIYDRCYEIRKSEINNKFLLYICDVLYKSFNSLDEAEKAANSKWNVE